MKRLMKRHRGFWAALFASVVFLLAVAAILHYPSLVSAQQTSTTTTLSAPSLTAQVSGGSVDLTWDAVSGATRYELWVWDSVNEWQQLGGDTLTGTTYTHTGVAVGTTYYYTIRTVSAAGETSAWSEYASVTIPSPTAPSVPELNARATASGVELSWDAVPGAVRYALWVWWDREVGCQRLDDGNLTGTRHTHSDVTAGTTYYYTVRAVNEEGETSAWSQYMSLTWSTAPFTPTATPTLAATVTATVTATPRTPQQDQSATATATPTLQTQQQPGQQHTATATATATDDQTSQNIPATGAPTFSGSAQVCETLTGDVSNIADENGLENVSFSVTWAAGEGYIRKLTANNFTYIVQSRDVGMTLSMSLLFRDDDGNSEFKSAKTAVVVAAAIPKKPQRAPAQVRVQTRGSGEFFVSWAGPSPVNCHDGGSPITGFKVQWKKAGDDWSSPSDVSEATTGVNESYTISGLTNGEEYTVRVIATNSVGDSAASTVVTATPQDSTTQ